MSRNVTDNCTNRQVYVYSLGLSITFAFAAPDSFHIFSNVLPPIIPSICDVSRVDPGHHLSYVCDDDGADGDVSSPV